MAEVPEDGRTWLLSGPTSSYAVHLTDRDELVHLHWGPRTGLADARELARRPLPDPWPFESPLDGREEYPVEGGPRFVRPALSVRTRERRGTERVFEGHEGHEGDEGHRGDDGELRLRFRDDGLTVTLHYRMRGDVVERWATPDNRGPAAEVLRADSATRTLPDRGSWRLSRLHGTARRPARRRPDRLREVGLQPLLHRRGLARRPVPAAAVDRPRARPVRPAGPAAGGPPGRGLRVLPGRGRADRPRHPRPHRPGVDLGQRRPARPARHPARLQPDPPGAGHGRLGHRQPEHHAERTGHSLRFRFVSAMAGVLGTGGDLTRWTGAELAEAREWIALYKGIRPVVQRGDPYRLRAPEGGLSAVQYVLGDETVVLARLPAQHHGEPVPALRLGGLDAASTYECCETGERCRGVVLLHHGLRTGLRGDLDAAVFRFRRLRSADWGFLSDWSDQFDSP
ncbi:hypothetical protein GCM10019016_119890 [Streptomyces prasinosporus]|uniref:Glycosyl hydrolase family 36 N-terminal domain-containing protein n=1 Tax=Streptomyces prasinosporus TaxID=68256 RepID=A0ABP6UAV8_9ACTN